MTNTATVNKQIYKISDTQIQKASSTVVNNKKQGSWTKEEIKNLLKTNDTMVVHSLLKLYTYQEAIEKASGETTLSNNVGFNAWDAQVLTKMAQNVIENKTITKAQVNYVRNKILKYSNQLTKIANGVL